MTYNVFGGTLNIAQLNLWKVRNARSKKRLCWQISVETGSQDFFSARRW